MPKFKQIKITYRTGEPAIFDLENDVTIFTGEDNAGKSTLIDLIYRMIGSSTENSLTIKNNLINKNIKSVILSLSGDIEHIWIPSKRAYYRSIGLVDSAHSVSPDIFKKTFEDSSKSFAVPTNKGKFTISPYTMMSFFRFNQTNNIGTSLSNKIGDVTSKALTDLALGKITSQKALQKQLEIWGMESKLNATEFRKNMSFMYKNDILKLESQIAKISKSKDEDVRFSAEEVLKRIESLQRAKLLISLRDELSKSGENLLKNIKSIDNIVKKTDGKKEIKDEIHNQLKKLEGRFMLSRVIATNPKQEIKTLNTQIDAEAKKLSISNLSKSALLISLSKQLELMKKRSYGGDEDIELIKMNLDNLRAELEVMRDNNRNSIEDVNATIRSFSKKFGILINEIEEANGFNLGKSNGDTLHSLILTTFWTQEIYWNIVNVLGFEYAPNLITFNRLLISASKTEVHRGMYSEAIANTIKNILSVEEMHTTQFIIQDKEKLLRDTKIPGVSIKEHNLNDLEFMILGEKK